MLLHKVERRIGIKDTDYSQRVYCPRAIDWAIETFEEILFQKNLRPDIPIVRAEVDWKKSVVWSDLIEIELHLVQVGNRSFTLESTIFSSGVEVAKVRIVHVLINQPLQPFVDLLVV